MYLASTTRARKPCQQRATQSLAAGIRRMAMPAMAIAAIDAFPRLLAIDAAAGGHPAFIAAHPDNQPDAD